MSDAAPEFSRSISLRQITGRPIELEANEAERAALARRFAIVAIERLAAQVTLDRDGDRVAAEGRLQAQIVQQCAVSGDDFPVSIDEPVAFRFVPAATMEPTHQSAEVAEIEIELEEEDLDEIGYSGETFDLGEAIAQSLALSIDPYAVGPDADAVREEAGLDSDDAPRGPLAEALAGLRKD
ncbi:YceD family protein [Alteriqipengyuania lutimaris]|uniref:DUF177 domain-containing protein n=1 Tax=Alteriqipengyuania lutimaris TaxID=1538146 RepID=A0A395LK61_9SPHN|nr:YceD family protein [Alteriqipengyuania lutimaris]MBB3033637.1 uncharacterized metal-binding protein YceD (DUF177 family) [Alteriqipengyuania lutimaris]RDS77368.1 DUF177 domain-containing protein [Alteriqipengyuania lutimaris]